MKKRMLCMLTILTMSMGTLPVTAYAENGLDVQRDGTIEIEGGKIEATGADFGGLIEFSGTELDLMEVESNPVERTEIEPIGTEIELVGVRIGPEGVKIESEGDKAEGLKVDPFADEKRLEEGMQRIEDEDNIELTGAAERMNSEEAQTEVIPSSDRTRVHLDGKSSDNDFSSIIRDDRTYLLMRFITDELGADVTWDAEEQSVTIEKGDLEIVIFIGQSYALVNGEKVVLDAPAFVKNGNAYLPLRFVAENLGAEVIWNSADRTVTIHYDE
ncbi:copper amine oxidase N-terminal domain-containing protein [Anaerotignum sp.]